MTAARAQILAAFLGVGLWAAFLLPPLELHARPQATGEAVALWCAHVLPLFSLLLVPWLGRETTFLAVFPAALVVPIAGSSLFDWPLAQPTRTADLVVAGLAFGLYAIAVPIALRRARARDLQAERKKQPRLGGTQAVLGRLHAVAVVSLPLWLAYTVHFNKRLQLTLVDSFADAAGYAAAFLDLTGLALGIVAADLAFFGPLRELRAHRSPEDAARAARERALTKTPTRGRALLALAAGGVCSMLLLGYVWTRG